MIRIFKTEDGAMHEKEEMQPGCWIALTNPTASEILEIADACQIDPDHLKAPLDEEERSRIEAEDEYTLILVDIPSIEERNGKDWFVTIPMAIITTKDVLITVCLEETPILTAFMDGRVRDFHTFRKQGLSYRSFIKMQPSICSTCALSIKRVKSLKTNFTSPRKMRN